MLNRLLSYLSHPRRRIDRSGGSPPRPADARPHDGDLLLFATVPASGKPQTADRSTTHARPGLLATLKGTIAVDRTGVVAGGHRATDSGAAGDSMFAAGRPSPADRRLLAKPTPNHRARVLSMKLAHLRMCSERRTEALVRIGIVTAGDLITAEALTIAKRMGAPDKAESTLRRYQQAVRLAAAVPGMMPRDALMLVSIHRRTRQALLIDSPAVLYRDLQRFAISTAGQRMLRGHRLPSFKRVRRWIDVCLCGETRITAT